MESAGPSPFGEMLKEFRKREHFTQQELATRPEVAIDLDGLAQLYREQGKYEQAEPLCQRALWIFEEKLGPTHPDTAVSLSVKTSV